MRKNRNKLLIFFLQAVIPGIENYFAGERKKNIVGIKKENFVISFKNQFF